MTKMIALKALRYGPHKYSPGDTFDVRTTRHMKVLKALGKAERHIEDKAPTYHRRDMKAEAAPVAAAEPDRSGILALRDEYEKVVGKRPFYGWDADTLRAKIGEHQATPEASE